MIERRSVIAPVVVLVALMSTGASVLARFVILVAVAVTDSTSLIVTVILAFGVVLFV
jgi:hypothetical protein